MEALEAPEKSRQGQYIDRLKSKIMTNHSSDQHAHAACAVLDVIAKGIEDVDVEDREAHVEDHE